jgi:hypothetical protein
MLFIYTIIPQNKLKLSFNVPRAGFEPATTRSSASPSATTSDWVERSPRLSYLGNARYQIKSEVMCFKVF